MKKRAKAGRRKSAPKAVSAIRKAFLKREAEAAYLRRVKYALGRSRPLPEPPNKSLAKKRDSFIVEYEETNPPEKRAKRKDRDKYYRERKRVEKKYGAKSRRVKKGRVRDEVYEVPFEIDSIDEENGEDKEGWGGISINRKAMRDIFDLEAGHDKPGSPRIVRAFIKARFKDSPKKAFWFAVKNNRLASDGADTMIDDIEAKAMEYAIDYVEAVEIVVSYIAR